MPRNGTPSRTNSNILSADRSVLLVAYGSDPLETLAALLLDRHQRELPDLSRHVVLFPHAGAIPPFRTLLLAAAERAGHSGLLAPWCGTLDRWLQQSTADDAALIDEPERDLLLLEALEPFAKLRERYGTWTLVDSLLALFDELNTHHGALPSDAEELATRLAAGYGAPATLGPLHGEAQMVHSLWQAWNSHLQSHRLKDRALQRRAALARPPAKTAHHIYMVGAVELSDAETQWLGPLLRAGRATLVLHGGLRGAGYHPDAALVRCLQALGAEPPAIEEPSAPYSRFIESVYAEDTAIGARARAFAKAHPKSPITERLHVYAASDFEQEANAVDLAVRRWYASGVRNIAIVTPDRKLARRTRALLERAGLPLRDSAGWILSTTSAATAVMRWIETVEQDFAQGPLLDFLKSPFVTLGFERHELERIAHCFEAEIVRAYNINAGLDRYRRAIRTVADRLSVEGERLLDMLARLERAAAPLRPLLGSRARAPVEHLTALRKSIDDTGLSQTLAADAAGAQVLTALRSDRRSLGARRARLHWKEFHHWLERELERRRFRPPLPKEGIELLGLAESRCRTFEAIVIAGCTHDNLPGALGSSPFFNDSVRRQLKLPTRLDRLLAPLHDYRRLLEAAPRILLTWRQSDGDEAMVPSPWSERLVAFHRLAYGATPDDVELPILLNVRATSLYRRDAPLPLPTSAPAPALPRERLPRTMSASAHQRLLDCPYQFYVVDGLGLRSLDDVREEMEKSDYGMHVHRILHAFHGGASGLPGPWTGGPITRENRAAAAQLLHELGRRVLGYETDKRLSARGWRLHWETFVSTYLDWQELRERTWRVEGTERTLERSLAIGDHALTLKGRADRIDSKADGLAILDYKTGAVPDTAAVLSGENGQLPFYALLHPRAVNEVTYVQLAPTAIKTNVQLQGDALERLVQHLEERLRMLIAAIENAAPLPAWGDARVCTFCRYEGLCRKEMWTEDNGKR